MAAVRAGEYGGHHSPMQKARARPAGPSAAALRSAQARHISPTRQRGASSSNAYGSFWRPTAEDSKGRVTSWAPSPAPRPEYRREKRSFAGVGLNHSASVVDEVVFGRDTDGSAAGRELDVRDNRYFSGAHGNTSKQLGLATNPLRVRSDHNPTVDRNASDVDVVVFGRDQDASGASGIPDDVTTTPMYAGASGTSSKVLGKGRWVGLRNTSDLAVPDASPPKPSRVQEMQYSSSEIGARDGHLHRIVPEEGLRRRAAAAAGAQEVPHRRRPRHPGVDGRRRRLRPQPRRRLRRQRRPPVGRLPRRLREDVERDPRLRQQERREAPRRSRGRPPGATSRRATSLGPSTTLPAAPAASTTDRMTASDYQNCLSDLTYLSLSAFCAAAPQYWQHFGPHTDGSHSPSMPHPGPHFFLPLPLPLSAGAARATSYGWRTRAAPRRERRRRRRRTPRAAAPPRAPARRRRRWRGRPRAATRRRRWRRRSRRPTAACTAVPKSRGRRSSGRAPTAAHRARRARGGRPSTAGATARAPSASGLRTSGEHRPVDTLAAHDVQQHRRLRERALGRAQERIEGRVGKEADRAVAQCERAPLAAADALGAKDVPQRLLLPQRAAAHRRARFHPLVQQRLAGGAAAQEEGARVDRVARRLAVLLDPAPWLVRAEEERVAAAPSRTPCAARAAPSRPTGRGAACRSQSTKSSGTRAARAAAAPSIWRMAPGNRAESGPSCRCRSSACASRTRAASARAARSTSSRASRARRRVRRAFRRRGLSTPVRAATPRASRRKIRMAPPASGSRGSPRPASRAVPQTCSPQKCPCCGRAPARDLDARGRDDARCATRRRRRRACATPSWTRCGCAAAVLATARTPRPGPPANGASRWAASASG